MTATRRQVEAVLTKYRGVPEHLWPRQYRRPRTERDFNLALALITDADPNVWPEYDDQDRVWFWHGIGLRDPQPGRKTAA